MPKFLLFLAGLLAATSLSAAEYPKMGDDIYDPQANGQALIDAALAQARAGGRHVLLDFGANWCVWCHRLHHTFATDPAVAAALQQNFVVVMVDVNTRHGPKRNADVITRYGNPVRLGLPVLVVLDADG
ncbi:MAG: thioredoxin family protein, partial [Opitutales bacterium]